ncbi:MAG TPA: hypothetical protein VL084_12110 [Thermoanaerobaculia bacterium]|nr:hypothetical protein [Thermoanaerobaculia bacterium]
MDPLTPTPAEGPPGSKARSLRVLIFAILLFGALLRVALFRDWPPAGVGFEEEEQGMAAGDLVEGRGALSALATLAGQEQEQKLPIGAATLSFAFLGVGLRQLRIPFLLSSLLIAPLLSLLLRRFVRPEIEAVVLFLYVVAWWPAAVSGVADEIFFTIPALLLALLLYERFRETKSPRTGFLLGVLSGVLLLEYTAYRAVGPLVFASLAAAGTAEAVRMARRDGRPVASVARAAFRGWAPGLAALVLSFVVTAGFLLKGSESRYLFVEALQRHRVHSQSAFARPAGELLTFVGERLAETARNLGNLDETLYFMRAPSLFDPVTAAVLGVSVLMALATPRRRPNALVGTWTLVFVGGAMFLTGNINLYRYSIVVPLLFLLSGFGLEAAWERLGGSRSRRLFLAVLSIAALGAGVWNLRVLFGTFIRDPEVRARWVFPSSAVAEWIRRTPRDAPVVVVCPTDDEGSLDSVDFRSPSRRWLVAGRNVRTFDLSEEWLPAPPDVVSGGRGSGFYYVFVHFWDRDDLVRKVMERYPGARPAGTIDVERRLVRIRTVFVPPEKRDG